MPLIFSGSENIPAGSQNPVGKLYRFFDRNTETAKTTLLRVYKDGTEVYVIHNYREGDTYTVAWYPKKNIYRVSTQGDQDEVIDPFSDLFDGSDNRTVYYLPDGDIIIMIPKSLNGKLIKPNGNTYNIRIIHNNNPLDQENNFPERHRNSLTFLNDYNDYEITSDVSEPLPYQYDIAKFKLLKKTMVGELNEAVEISKQSRLSRLFKSKTDTMDPDEIGENLRQLKQVTDNLQAVRATNVSRPPQYRPLRLPSYDSINAGGSDHVDHTDVDHTLLSSYDSTRPIRSSHVDMATPPPYYPNVLPSQTHRYPLEHQPLEHSQLDTPYLNVATNDTDHPEMVDETIAPRSITPREHYSNWGPLVEGPWSRRSLTPETASFENVPLDSPELHRATLHPPEISNWDANQPSPSAASEPEEDRFVPLHDPEQLTQEELDGLNQEALIHERL